MGRPDSALSVELERSMNMQIRVETFEEHLRHAGVIDKLDDDRRKKSFDLDKWNEDMQKCFSRSRKELLEMNDLIEVREGLMLLDKKINNFNTMYSLKRSKLQELEIQYETLDDEVRSWLLEYALSCREKLRIENSTVERKLIEENLTKKKVKGLNN